MKLYQKQQAIVDKLETAFDSQNQITESHLFLSGEMGVGKTYMGAAIANNHAHQGVIIIVPDLVSKKWYNVLTDLNPDLDVTLVDAQFCNKNPMINYQSNHVTIIPDKYFNRLFNRKNEDLARYLIDIGDFYDAHDNQFDREEFEDDLRGDELDIQKARNFIEFKNQAPFLIFDEIHQAKKSKLDCLNDLLNNPTNNKVDDGKFNLDNIEFLSSYNFDASVYEIESDYQNNDIFPALFLTGTIFNVDHHALDNLLAVTNSNIIKYQGLENYTVSKNITIFISMIWRYISVSLSMADMNLDTQNDIHQVVEPIETIELTPVEKAFYELVLAQLNANTGNVAESTHKRQFLLASNLLDFPEKKPVYEIKKAKRKDYFFRYNQQLSLAVPLDAINLNQTKKYLALKNKLDNHQKQKTVIYATDTNLIKQLVDNLNDDGYQTETLPDNLDASEYSTYINTSLKSNDIFVVNPNDITVGVDINAEVLIWYQLLSDMTDIIQAQRRVYRMNSDNDSTVILLPYALTYQEELVDEISNSAKNNAASYGVQDRSELAKKTSILLEAVEQKNSTY